MAERIGTENPCANLTDMLTTLVQAVDSGVLSLAGLIVQIVTALVAIGASLVALFISGRDRRALLEIARRERAHARLRTELEYAVRLSTNRNMGGSSDRAESERMGAEALALAGVVGERWVPRQFSDAMDGKSSSELAAMLDDPESETPEWVKHKIEAGLAVQQIVAAFYADGERHG